MTLPLYAIATKEGRYGLLQIHHPLNPYGACNHLIAHQHSCSGRQIGWIDPTVRTK